MSGIDGSKGPSSAADQQTRAQERQPSGEQEVFEHTLRLIEQAAAERRGDAEGSEGSTESHQFQATRFEKHAQGRVASYEEKDEIDDLIEDLRQAFDEGISQEEFSAMIPPEYSLAIVERLAQQAREDAIGERVAAELAEREDAAGERVAESLAEREPDEE